MATNKKDIFLADEQRQAQFAKALSHPARLAILKALASGTELICAKLVDQLPLAQSTVSQHLKELKDAGLITGTADGPRSCYFINWPQLNQAMLEMNQLFEQLKENEPMLALNNLKT